MLSIMRQEGKRLCTKNVLWFYGLCILAGLLLSYLLSYGTIYYTSSNTYIRGPQAIEKLQKQTIEKEIVPLWQESYEMIQQIVQQPNMVEDAHGFSVAGLQKLQPYQDIAGIQWRMYAGVNHVPSFEDLQILRTENWRKAFIKQGITEERMEHFLEAHTPSATLEFEASTGIRNAFSHISYFLIFLMIFFTIIMTSLYAKDRTTHMDVLLLSTKDGRKKVIFFRIIAAFLFITILYGIAILIYTMYSIVILHMQASSTPYNLTKETLFSYETLTCTTAYAKAMLMGYVGVLGASSVAICISACSKRREIGILLALGMVLYPISPLASTLPEAIQALCSSTLTNAIELFNSLHVHIVWNQLYMESDFRILCSVILILLFLGSSIGIEYAYAKYKGLRL